MSIEANLKAIINAQLCAVVKMSTGTCANTLALTATTQFLEQKNW